MPPEFNGILNTRTTYVAKNVLFFYCEKNIVLPLFFGNFEFRYSKSLVEKFPASPPSQVFAVTKMWKKTKKQQQHTHTKKTRKTPCFCVSNIDCNPKGALGEKKKQCKKSNWNFTHSWNIRKTRRNYWKATNKKVWKLLYHLKNRKINVPASILATFLSFIFTFVLYILFFTLSKFFVYDQRSFSWFWYPGVNRYQRVLLRFDSLNLAVACIFL